MPAVYDDIGRAYASARRPDPRIAAAIEHALEGCSSVLNAEGLKRLRKDLQSGGWIERHRSLRSLDERDLGYRAVTARHRR